MYDNYSEYELEKQCFSQPQHDADPLSENQPIMRKDHYFEISAHSISEDFRLLTKVVNMGIDARLEAFTLSEFKMSNGRLFCWIHPNELQILIRRLLELEDDNADQLADDIVMIHYGYEVI